MIFFKGKLQKYAKTKWIFQKNSLNCHKIPDMMLFFKYFETHVFLKKLLKKNIVYCNFPNPLLC